VIDSLKPNEVFVFGSNIDGHHMAGAAKQAMDSFGAEWGIGVGLTGQCYAIPTMEGIVSLAQYVNQFIEVAKLLPTKTFLLTPVGQGIAGFTADEIEPLFTNLPDNIIKTNWSN